MLKQLWKVGDLVVHVNHGVGRYQGVETLVIGGAHKDYLLVEYAGEFSLSTRPNKFSGCAVRTGTFSTSEAVRLIPGSADVPPVRTIPASTTSSPATAAGPPTSPPTAGAARSSRTSNAPSTRSRTS